MQAGLLALLSVHPDEEASLSEVACLAGVTVSGVPQEVIRLMEAGLIVDRRVGNNRMVRADTSSVLTGPPTNRLAVARWPRPVRAAALRDVALNVERAYIYGCRVACDAGVPGPSVRDVDLHVVSTADIDNRQDPVGNRPAIRCTEEGRSKNGRKTEGLVGPCRPAFGSAGPTSFDVRAGAGERGTGE